MKTNAIVFAFLMLLIGSPLVAAKNFTVVIDPGHGGKDPGAIGKIGQEKTINLNVSLLVGKMIEDRFSDVDVVYTRKTDKYVTLQDRPNIANKANGDLYISIHTNASESKSAYGAETFTLGLSKSNANFEVSKRENSVLLLEDGNKETYQGFDPTSPDSYIMFEFMQSKYVDQSVEMAYYVQKEFTSIKRLDRGVRQAIFWVLHQVKMPSILIELGFITNTNEETFLLSFEGQQKLAASIFNGFVKYKHEYDKRTVDVSRTNQTTEDTTNTPSQKPDSAKTAKSDSNNNRHTEKKVAINEKAPTTRQDSTPGKTKTTETTTDIRPESGRPIYKIRVFSLRRQLKGTENELARLKKLGIKYSYFVEDDWYKYTVGEYTTLKEAQEQLTIVKQLFKDAFITAWIDGKSVKIHDAQQHEK